MISSAQRTENLVLPQKLKLQRSKNRKTSDCTQSGPRTNKFNDLRQISPKKIMEQSIFSENFLKMSKFGLKIKEIQTEQGPSFTNLKDHIQKKKINSNFSIRKQTEKFLSFQYPMKINKKIPQTQRNGCSDRISPVKSLNSTKANSQISAKQNISVQQFIEQKSIIQLNKKQQDRNQISQSTLTQQEIILKQSQKIKKLKQVTIDDFDILNFCGEGVFGSVYIGRHKKTNSVYALKKIVKIGLIDDTDKQCLIRQIKIHLKLNHPNIIKFYGFFSSDKAVYFILELCTEGNLYEIMQEKQTFSEKQAKNAIKQICQGLDYLHGKNIIHRDLKAENIIIQNNVVKICDFGWASQGQYSRKSLCGTPAYISPEVVQNKLYDKKVDIWSLGVLCYELIFGRIPFDIKSQQDFSKILNQEVLFPAQKSISPSFKDFIMNCLQKDSFKRWDTSRLLKHSFLN